MSDIMDDATLFDIERPPPVSLADKFVVPPMSVLDRRGGLWIDRKRRWLSMGLTSGLGRDDDLLRFSDMIRTAKSFEPGASVFDPVLCELVYRWFSPHGGQVLDPFAGGSVRGVVASVLGRWYTGIDLRPEQVAANDLQADLGSDIVPQWLVGDARKVLASMELAYECDLLFSCPPYADLERYSDHPADHPADLSTMDYEAFTEAHREIIRKSLARLRSDRFAAWVISDVRDRRGAYRGLVADTIRAFTDCGAHLYNDAVILDQVGTNALRMERPFLTSRKLARVHQHLLVFIKGDARKAAERIAAADEVTETEVPA